MFEREVLMGNNLIIGKVAKCVHSPISWGDYLSTNVMNATNGLSHAIGSTVIENPSIYRLGMISGKKPFNEEYTSIEEVKELFLADLSTLQLGVTDITGNCKLKHYVINNVLDLKLDSKEHIVLLFVKVYCSDGKTIEDFHFIRYDADRGWSEKRKGTLRFINDILLEWPSPRDYQLVGSFKIRR